MRNKVYNIDYLSIRAKLMLTTFLLIISPSILILLNICIRQVNRTLTKCSVVSNQDNLNSSPANTSINNQVKTSPNYNSSSSYYSSYDNDNDNDDYNSTNYWQRLNEIQEENQMEREFYEDTYTSDPD